jgi:hypothetical protein
MTTTIKKHTATTTTKDGKKISVQPSSNGKYKVTYTDKYQYKAKNDGEFAQVKRTLKTEQVSPEKLKQMLPEDRAKQFFTQTLPENVKLAVKGDCPATIAAAYLEKFPGQLTKDSKEYNAWKNEVMEEIKKGGGIQPGAMVYLPDWDTVARNIAKNPSKYPGAAASALEAGSAVTKVNDDTNVAAVNDDTAVPALIALFENR